MKLPKQWVSAPMRVVREACMPPRCSVRFATDTTIWFIKILFPSLFKLVRLSFRFCIQRPLQVESARETVLDLAWVLADSLYQELFSWACKISLHNHYCWCLFSSFQGSYVLRGPLRLHSEACLDMLVVTRLKMEMFTETNFVRREKYA